ncbi:hypothetical protein RB620_25725 [Paenibacillus sp. LHD-117]|uniref:hypothetical protein n=1 Tax=Paenibacillus sp. LHD-117 TaxID=3071412 RepID=UPI0027E20A73|nr:hypothetical protein [Paenibacillus sp. LHD-117]MDQ6422831.1 hypothetical protein [Paenibacillus sp. LHD-117]
MKSKSAPMAAFIGTTPNIGTTTAAFSAAVRLAEATGKPIGYLCLNLKSAKLYRFLGVDEPETTLDKLQPELRSASMTPSMLLRATHALPRQPNLHILFGSVNREQAEFFSDKELEHLLDVAEQAFSFVVLDLGAYWDNAATVCSIRRAATRIVVTTGALSHFQEDGRRWIGEVSPLFQVQPEQYECVVVRGTSGHASFSPAQISRELGAASLGELHLTPALYASLDKGALGDWLKEDKGGKAAMAAPARLLANRYGLGAFPRKDRQPWYLKLANMRGGVGSA